jgi:hypothetical protein
MNLFGLDRTAELEVSFMVDLPPQRVYQLLREEAGTNERVTDAIDESPSGAPGTVWRLRVQAGGSRRWIRSRVVVDEPPLRLDITCAPIMPYLRRFETTCSYVLRPGAGGGTTVVLTVQTPVGAGSRFIRPRSESQLRERLEIEARRWAARVSGDDSVPVPETTVRVYGKLVPLTLFGVGAVAFLASRVTRSYLVLPAGAVLGWIALLFAMRHPSSVVARPAVRPRAPRVRTIRQVRLRRGLMLATSAGFAVVIAHSAHHWQNGVTAFAFAFVVQWLGARMISTLRRQSNAQRGGSTI